MPARHESGGFAKPTNTENQLMPCYIGMTQDLARRKKEQQQKYQTLRNFRQIAGPFQSASVAQDTETRLANQLGCYAEPGGSGSGPWYVYQFEY